MSSADSGEKAEAPLPRAQDVHIIVCDVDGTLNTTKHVIHPRTVDAIKHIRKTRPELPIVVSSGKQYISCSTIREQLDLDEFPASHAHGAIVYGPRGRIVHMHSLPTETVLSVCEYTRRRNLATFIFTESECLLVNREEDGKDWAKIGSKYDSNVEDMVDRREEILETIKQGRRKVVKFSICTEPERMSGLMINLASQFPGVGLTRAIPFILELHDPHINKGTSLTHICNDLGIEPKNAITFGDGENDVSMFRVAQWSVAMGNAMQAAKDAATYIGQTNDEGGVGVFLDRVFR